MGKLAADWIQQRADDSLVNVFGYTALQLGLESSNLLSKNHIRSKVILTQDQVDQLDDRDNETDAEPPLRDELPFQKELEQIYEEPTEIPQPFAEELKTKERRKKYLDYDNESVDLIVLPFTLDWHDNPHHILREAERVLLNEGKLVIFGFNPYSLWGLRNKLSHFPYLPISNKQQISLKKTKDWLQLLSFEIDRGQLGCYEPAFMNEKWLSKCAFMNKAGNRWWPFAGAIFYIAATKRHINPSFVGAVPIKKKKTKLRPATIATKNNF